MFTENGVEIALINTDGYWYGLLTRLSDGLKYHTLGYTQRDEAKRMSILATYILAEAK